MLLKTSVLHVYCWNAFELWQAHTSDNVCELKRREILNLPGLSSFPRISYWCLPGRSFRSQTFCLKNPFLFTSLPSLINSLLPFQKPINNPDMLDEDTDDDDGDDNTIKAATNAFIACYPVPGSFPSTLQGLTYWLLRTTLWGGFHHPPH